MVWRRPPIDDLFRRLRDVTDGGVGWSRQGADGDVDGSVSVVEGAGRDGDKIEPQRRVERAQRRREFAEGTFGARDGIHHEMVNDAEKNQPQRRRGTRRTTQRKNNSKSAPSTTATTTTKKNIPKKEKKKAPRAFSA